MGLKMWFAIIAAAFAVLAAEFDRRRDDGRRSGQKC